jgi:fused signal recognition particle receptor
MMFSSNGDGLFAKLGKTRKSLTDGLKGLFSSSTTLDAAAFDDMEDRLIMADMGGEASARVVDALRARTRREKIGDVETFNTLLKNELVKILAKAERAPPDPGSRRPYVILMVGVNGVGKTTTVAKLAHYFRQQGHTVMLAACDTYRAAAVEQLQRWGERLGVPVIAQGHGADAAAVAHDAVQAARARGMDVLIIDSAGRQHVNADLMEQLSKVARVVRKVDANAPHDVWLTVDAGNGQNVLSQIEHFSKAVPLTGLCVTKLDGTARGGVLLAVAQQFDLGIPFLGVGEGLDDLRPFRAEAFVEALVATHD